MGILKFRKHIAKGTELEWQRRNCVRQEMNFRASKKSVHFHTDWRYLKTNKMREETIKNRFKCIRVILIRVNLCVLPITFIVQHDSKSHRCCVCLLCFILWQQVLSTPFEREAAEYGLGCHPDLHLKPAAPFMGCVALGKLYTFSNLSLLI